MRHFLDLNEIPKASLRAILDEAARRKQNRRGKNKGARDDDAPLQDILLALLFEQASTRTRISFDAAISQLGGRAIMLDAKSAHLHRGETFADTARVLSHYVDAIMLRTHDHQHLLAMADAATIPVINGLTNKSHPCQILAALLSFEEKNASKDSALKDIKVAWIGDSNNVACSWVHAAAAFDFELHLACPHQADFVQTAIQNMQKQGANITTSNDPKQAAKNADIITTDSWISLSDDPASAHTKQSQLIPYQITPELMQLGKKNAAFMHCLPVFRGKEVVAEIADGNQSLIFEEAENRLHVQKAVLLWVFRKAGL